MYDRTESLFLHILIKKGGAAIMGRLVINGDEIYELDEECMREKQEKEREKRRHHAFEEEKQKTPSSRCSRQ